MIGSRFVLTGLSLLSLAFGIGEVSRAGDLAPTSPDEPRSRTLSLERAAGYLDEVALDWTRSRKCGTCHTNYAYMLARPSVREVGSADAMVEIRAFFESRVEHWDDDAKPPGRGGTPR